MHQREQAAAAGKKLQVTLERAVFVGRGQKEPWKSRVKEGQGQEQPEISNADRSSEEQK